MALEELLPIRQRDPYKSILWNDVEESFCICDTCCEPENTITFSEALQRQLERTPLSLFLRHLNKGIRHDQEALQFRLEMYVYDQQFPRDPDDSSDDEEEFCDNLVPMLQDNIDSETPIIQTTVIQQLQAVRLPTSRIGEVDSGVSELKNLQALSLAGNLLSLLPARMLPRSLKFLELFYNRLTDLAALGEDWPPCLVQLGLARNGISDESNLHLLGERGTNLCCVDLGENDICDLERTLQLLSTLSHLLSLRLEGNPCSLCCSYRELVLLYFPALQYLDNVEIWPVDRILPTECSLEDEAKRGAVVFLCYRIMGIPQPTKEVIQGMEVKHLFCIELELPLLDVQPEESPEPQEAADEDKASPDKSENKEEGDVDTPEKKGRKGGKGKGSKRDSKRKSGTDEAKEGKGRKSVKEKRSKKESKDKSADGEEKGKGGKKRKTKELPPLLNPVDEPSPSGFTRYSTTKQEWNPVIRFPDPPLQVEGDLKALRDTLRSVVLARVIYERALPPEKKKKEKNGKGKKGSKAGKKASKSGKKESKTSRKKSGKGTVESLLPSDEKRGTVQEEVPQDTVLSRTTVAHFHVQLEPVAWDEVAKDYLWNEEEEYSQAFEQQDEEQVWLKLAPKAAENLKDLVYKEESEDDKKKKKKKGSEAGKKGSDAGKKGSVAGKKGSDAGKKGSVAGKKGSDAGKKGKSKKGKKKEEEEIDTRLPLPEQLTVHMGFGVKRLQVLSPVPELVVEEEHPPSPRKEHPKRKSRSRTRS